jgi:hypothetical protein
MKTENSKRKVDIFSQGSEVRTKPEPTTVGDYY